MGSNDSPLSENLLDPKAWLDKKATYATDTPYITFKNLEVLDDWIKHTASTYEGKNIDKGHIHNHIYYNSTAQDCSRKFHNFIGSSFAVRRLSDRVCIEHELSVIQNPKQHSKGRFLHYGQWIGEKPPSAQQRVRLGIVAALEQKPADFPAFLRLMEESGWVSVFISM